ncbi:hypothetical protein [Micromonospora maritima]|uniref:hypothetical protein n=1 Tax=Micromonospora maritima TaxID=986711 RepID=UPI00157DA9F3|nr:hypothetical protein [Micromonospora maritima]
MFRIELSPEAAELIEDAAKLHSGTGGHPAIEVAGVLVFLYIKDGKVQVSVDLDTAIPEVTFGPDRDVPLHITVQGQTVFDAP